MLKSDAQTFTMEWNAQLLNEVGWSCKLQVVEVPFEDPKSYLAQKQTYVGMLFELMSRENMLYVEQAWHILNIVPCSQELRTKIESVNVEVRYEMRCRKVGRCY